MTKNILAIDLGTSRIRAGVFNNHPEPIAVAARDYPIYAPEQGAAEQAPLDWLGGLYEAIAEVMEKTGSPALEGIAFSGQMHGTVLLNGKHEPLRNAIIWCDQRGKQAVNWIQGEIGSEKHGKITGNPLATGFQAATLGFLKQQEGVDFSKISKVLLPKDYLIWELTREFVTEPTDAVSTGLFNLDLPEARNMGWSDELLALLGLSTDQFPALTESLLPKVPGGDKPLSLTQSAAQLCGLPSGLPILASGGDAVLGGTIAMGFDRYDEAIGLISSGGQLLMSRAHATPAPAEGIHLLPQLVPGSWFAMAAFLAAGLSLDWWRKSLENLLKRSLDMTEIIQSASQAPSGCDGLIFLPHIAGERTPLLDADASGAFIGIRKHHGLGEFARAILEGVASSFRWGLEILEREGGSASAFHLGGGGTKSGLWCQIFADALKREVGTFAEISETSLAGAALAGAKAIGCDLAAWKVEQLDAYQPSGAGVDRLDDNYRRFVHLASEMSRMNKERP